MIHECITINGIELDKSIAPLITELWLMKVRTYQCCGGGKVDLAAAGFKDVQDFIFQGNSVTDPSGAFYLFQGVVYEKAYIITHKDDLEKLLRAIPNSDPYVEYGTGGYVLSEYCDNPCSNDDAVFVMFKFLPARAK